MSGTCALCPKKAFDCSFCHKIGYCGVEHQRVHRAEHKPDCFPAAIKDDKTRGKFLVATRTIQPGELFLKEVSMIYGPSGLPNGSMSSKKICLSCYKPVFSDYVCSKCAFPVCNAVCEKVRPFFHIPDKASVKNGNSDTFRKLHTSNSSVPSLKRTKFNRVPSLERQSCMS